MKILAFSDFHGLWGLKDHFIEVKKKLEQYQPDLLLLCGDLQDRGTIKLLENRIQNLQFSPVYFIWGNSEEQLNLNQNVRFAENIHLVIKSFMDANFIGVGGDEYDMKNELPRARKMISKLPKNELLVIVSHVPPFQALDLCNDGRNVGVAKFRELIEKYQPKLVLCGHIHENAQKIAWIGRSMVCNVGSNGVLFNIDNNKVTARMLE